MRSKPAIAEAKKAVEEGGVERMNNAFNALQAVSHKMAEAALPADVFGAGAVKRLRPGVCCRCFFDGPDWWRRQRDRR